jgi:hypothetical protein
LLQHRGDAIAQFGILQMPRAELRGTLLGMQRGRLVARATRQQKKQKQQGARPGAAATRAADRDSIFGS